MEISPEFAAKAFWVVILAFIVAAVIFLRRKKAAKAQELSTDGN